MAKHSKERLLLSAQMVVDELEKEGYDIIFHPGNDSNCLEGIQFFLDCNRIQIDERFLYVPMNDKADFTHIFSLPVTFITWNLPKEYLPSSEATVIEIKEPFSVVNLYNLLFHMFQRYQQWDYEIQLAAQKGDIQLLAQLGSDFLENPLFVHDENFNYLAKLSWIAGQTVPTINKRTGLGMIPLDVVDSLENSSIYLDTLETRGAHIYENYTLDSYRVLYVNLWDKNNVYHGRLCIDEIATPIRPGQFYIAEYFSDRILQTLENQRANIRKDHSNFQKLLELVLKHNFENIGDLKNELNNVGWAENDEYLVLSFNFYDKEHVSISPSNTCYELENHIEESCAFTDDTSIWLITNLTKGNHAPDAVQGRIDNLLENTLYHVGISNILYNFWDLSYAAEQARLVLNVNTHLKINAYCSYKFSDYVLQIILTYGTSCLPYPFLISPSLEKLKKYDADNNANLLQTLYIYLLCERNVAQAAQKLFIHRSTMVYRIERIEQLTGLILDDFNERLYLEISFQLMNHADKNTGQTI